MTEEKKIKNLPFCSECFKDTHVIYTGITRLRYIWEEDEQSYRIWEEALELCSDCLNELP